MPRIGGAKNRAGGRWTDARFNSFIKSLLRAGSKRWAPISDTLKEARTRRGFYRCNGCGEEVPATLKVGARRIKNAVVDHVDPIIDPNEGFVSWDQTIERMFCEKEGLQVLCHACHEVKTKQERDIATERRRNNK